MQSAMGNELTQSDSRSAAMTWIGSLLESIAERLAVEIGGWKWDICGTGDDTTSYQLIILGNSDKRAIKMFTAAELDRCLNDPEIQDEFTIRLTPLVIFIGSKVRKNRP